MRPIGRWLTGFAVLALAAAAPALDASAALMRQGSVEVQGRQRGFSLYFPSSAPQGARLPVVVMLHGGAGRGEAIAQQTGLPGYVDRGGFIAVFPETDGRQWNDGRETTRSSFDDVAFLVAVVRDVVTRGGGDPARVFVAGASSGGMMVQRLACDTNGVFAGYAVAIANLPSGLVNSCHPSRRVPMIFFDSTTDPIMPWGGGEIAHGYGRGAGGRVLSTPQTIDFWARIDGCSPPRTETLAHSGGGTSVIVHDYSGCGLMLYEIRGGGHTWPGSAQSGGWFAQRVVGSTTHDISATSLMIDFFRRHGL